MSWQQKEKAIREKRTNLAITNGFMGPEGKLGTIAIGLGDPIVRQGTGSIQSNYLDDPYEDFSDCEYGSMLSEQDGPLVSRDKILDLDDEESEEEGYVFDGLRRGIHLEIQFYHDSNRLVVTYQGHLVYEEVSGELLAYNPFPEWEEKVHKLHKAAQKNYEERMMVRKSELSNIVERKKLSLWEQLKKRWGNQI